MIKGQRHRDGVSDTLPLCKCFSVSNRHLLLKSYREAQPRRSIPTLQAKSSLFVLKVGETFFPSGNSTLPNYSTMTAGLGLIRAARGRSFSAPYVRGPCSAASQQGADRKRTFPWKVPMTFGNQNKRGRSRSQAREDGYRYQDRRSFDSRSTCGFPCALILKEPKPYVARKWSILAKALGHRTAFQLFSA